MIALAAGCGLVLAAGAVIGTCASSPASVGTGTQVGPVRVTVAAGSTQRARIQVRDTGSAAETLTILGGQPHGDQIIPLSWVRPASVTTAPGIWRTVVFTVAVPASTRPGRYRRYAGASAAPGSNPGGASFGATSYTDLVITVVPSAASSHATRRNDHTPTKATGA